MNRRPSVFRGIAVVLLNMSALTLQAADRKILPLVIGETETIQISRQNVWKALGDSPLIQAVALPEHIKGVKFNKEDLLSGPRKDDRVETLVFNLGRSYPGFENTVAVSLKIKASEPLRLFVARLANDFHAASKTYYSDSFGGDWTYLAVREGGKTEPFPARCDERCYWGLFPSAAGYVVQTTKAGKRIVRAVSLEELNKIEVAAKGQAALILSHAREAERERTAQGEALMGTIKRDGIFRRD